MPELKKGQIVAAWSSNYSSRHIRIFVEKGISSFGDPVFLCRDAGEDEKYAIPWPHCLPLEDVEPGAFLARERRAREQSDYAVEMESELVQRLRRQIGWLCQELAHADMCPSVSAIASCDHDCATCWDQASLSAVGEDVNDQA